MSKSSKREILGMSKITYKYQITVPKRVRERFLLKKGDTLVFIEENDTIIISKSTEY